MLGRRWDSWLGVGLAVAFAVGTWWLGERVLGYHVPWWVAGPVGCACSVVLFIAVNAGRDDR